MDTHIHATKAFYRAFDAVCEALEQEHERTAAEFTNRLAKLVHFLESYEWNDEERVRPRGWGSEYEVGIDRDFILVLRRETDRDGEGHPLRSHVYLLTIERRRAPATNVPSI